MSVVKPFKQFVSQFPLVVYPSQSADVPLPASRFSFRNSPQTADSFNLGVYNVVSLSFDNRVAASLDPVCFYCMILLAYKNGYKLPLLDGESAGNCVSVLSFHSSTDGHLPVLIEDEDDKKARRLMRKVRSAATIEKFNLSAVTNPKELMYIQLVDTRLYDYFTLRVLQTSAISVYCPAGELFSRSMECFVTRNNFHLRNPAIAAHATSTFQVSLKHSVQAAQQESDRCASEGKQLLAWLEDLLEDEVFFEKPGVLDFKLAAYVYALMNIEDVELGYPKLKAHCRRIIAGAI
ncbi:hypothetical protein OGAPHI_005781 [Ogataea philodendri]|uniref:Uncharacterized protein n=1 Tax=Ogataea philodendri TaxID=1378263 RepID=A0A9P8NZW6_9ASCO|nr:uncharacterized protein OGAPHI_005781 [Ogataea philodendri]KAH3662529.1 hypothetical protein OGAPHI_005781 [Ogataea philodendri]